MKQILFISLLILCPLQIFAQQGFRQGQAVKAQELGIAPDFQLTTSYDVIDEAKLIVTYTVTMNLAPEYEEGTFEDILTLEIGTKVSKCYSQTLHKEDLLWTNEEVSSGERVWVRNAFIYPSIGEEVYKYSPYGGQKEDIVTLRLFGFDDVYRYADNKPAFNWRLTGEKKVILGYNCQKGVTDFRGRTYEAWFTTELPFRDGPYKFDGLPGLILDIQDKEGHYHWSCTGIVVPKTKETINQYQWNYVPTTREKVRATVEKAYSKTTQYLLTTRIYLVEKVNDRYQKVNKFSLPYNPIERN